MPKRQTAGESDLEKVIQALECQTARGPFFQVGGEFIDPTEIVSFSGPRDAATFDLLDGRTVQNDRFLEGDVGDLLFDALQVLRRPENKTQAIKPAFNLVILGLPRKAAFDPAGNTLNSYQGNWINGVDTTAGYVFSTPGNNGGNATRQDLGGGGAQTLDISGAQTDADNQSTVVEEKQSQELYGHITTSGGNHYATSVGYDGQNPSTLYQLATGNSPDNASTIAIDKDEGLGFAGDERFNLDGSGITSIGIGNKRILRLDREAKEIFQGNVGFNDVEVYDYQGSSKRTISTGIVRMFDVIPNENLLLYSDGNDILQKDLSTGQENALLPSNTVKSLRAALDLSAI